MVDRIERDSATMAARDEQGAVPPMPSADAEGPDVIMSRGRIKSDLPHSSLEDRNQNIRPRIVAFMDSAKTVIGNAIGSVIEKTHVNKVGEFIQKRREGLQKGVGALAIAGVSGFAINKARNRTSKNSL